MPPKRRQETAAEAYDHKDREALLRPDVGLQAQFKKRKPPANYRYDPSLDPELSWDINADRNELGAWADNTSIFDQDRFIGYLYV